MFFERSVGLFTLFLIGLLALAACGGGDSDKAAEHYVKGTVYTIAEPWGNAIKEFDESIRLDPKAAIAYGDQGGFGKAIEDYTAALRLDASNADAYYSRGYSRYHLGDTNWPYPGFATPSYLSPTTSRFTGIGD